MPAWTVCPTAARAGWFLPLAGLGSRVDVHGIPPGVFGPITAAANATLQPGVQRAVLGSLVGYLLTAMVVTSLCAAVELCRPGEGESLLQKPPDYVVVLLLIPSFLGSLIGPCFLKRRAIG